MKLKYQCLKKYEVLLTELDDNKDEINKIQCIPFHVIDGGCGYVTD